MISIKKNDVERAPSAKEIIELEKALSERPSFSIRFRITVAFLILFLFSSGICISLMIFISMMNDKQNFFDNAAKFGFTVEQARRHEKNLFLYHSKTDLYDALSNINEADSMLLETANEMRSLLKQDTFKKLTNDLVKYKDLLQQVVTNFELSHDSEIESQLRIFGHRILSYAIDLMDQERGRLHDAVRTFMVTAFFLLIINFIIMIWGTSELARQILRPLGRAVQYTERIANGDFTLIIPRRKFRDEFSNLAIAINRMIFELMEKHEQLVQSRKMAAVGILTSGIAHELNNPLNNISLTTETLIDDWQAYSADEIQGMLNDIFVQVERASTTVRNLLDFTRIEHSHLEPIEVPGLIDSSLELVRNERQLKGIVTQLEIGDALPKIKGNYRNLQQVFLNIFINGIHAMADRGVLWITAVKEDPYFVKIDIADNGCGIADKDIDSIFDPFFTTKEVGKGTGLGLSVSYGIIKDIGGRITVESEIGRGSVFSVYLPVADNQPKESGTIG